jgi:hypothetical protein
LVEACAGLSRAARQEREHALAEVNQLCGEALELAFNALALGQQPPDYDSRCPFRGLYSFRVEDREFFFGREGLIERTRCTRNCPARIGSASGISWCG